MSPRVTCTESVDLTTLDLAEIHDLRTRAADFFAEVGDDPPTLKSLEADLTDLPEGYTRADEVVYRGYAVVVADAFGTREHLAAYAEVLRGWPDAGSWIIGILLVDAERRSEGIGHAVVEAVAGDAREAGQRALLVGVISSRERSLAFWKREGFTREVNRRPLLIGDEQHEVVRLQRAL